MAIENWTEGVSYEAAIEAIEELEDGHRRFRTRAPRGASYGLPEIQDLWREQHPIAAIIGCSDSRTAPEIIFDQPLGGIFASRVPGNVASDSAKWMLEIAVAEIKVPVVAVIGHTGCLAISQLLDHRAGGSGNLLRFDVMMAIHRARVANAPDVYRAAVTENVKLTIENLLRDSVVTQRALEQNRLALIGFVYDMERGEIERVV